MTRISYANDLAQPELTISFTDQERAWLKQHPVVRVGVDADFPPYEFVSQYNQHIGISSEYLKILSKVTGIRFEVTPNLSWSDVLQHVKEKKIDLLPLVTASKERRKYLTFSDSYIPYQMAIVSPTDTTTVRSLTDLAAKKVALVRNYFASKQVLERQPDIQPYYVDTVIDGLKAVAEGEAVSMVADVGTMSYMIRSYALATLSISGFVDIPAQGFSMGVRDDWPELAGILDKVLMAMPEHHHQQIMQRWIEAAPEEEIITLSKREKEFIRQHPFIRLGIDPEFAPFEYMEKGTYSGMASDYIKLLNKRLGLNMQVVDGLTWKQAVEGAQGGKIDVLPCVGLTEERTSFLNFTEPYINFHRVIITRTDLPFITGLGDIDHLKVAVQDNSSHEGFLRENSKITPIGFDTLSQALLALSSGDVDAFIGNVASSTYWIRKMNLTNLKVAAPLSQEFQSLHFAVRKDWPELISILQKGLDSINNKQRKKISEKWLLMKYDPVTDYLLIGQVAIGFTLLLLLVFIWNVKIRRQNKAIQMAEREALAANLELSRMHEELEELVQIRTAELNESEKNFRQAQKMEALGTLVGGIAHDFNNILAGMLGSIYLAKSSSKDSEKLNKSLSEANDLGFRAADLIKQLLAFARQEEVSKSILALKPFFKEATKLIKAGLEENIRFNTVFGECELFVHANSTQLQQLLFNLVNNARDASEHCIVPEITVRLDQFVANEAFIKAHPEIERDQFALIEVTDNGTGIRDENLDQLFDPFFTTKEVGKGTGLGLAMVYSAVREHGGAIEVNSQLGHGSSFKVYLPLEKTQVGQADRKSEEVWQGSGETILLVDDDEKLLHTHETILSGLGYWVLVARDGKEALEVFERDRDRIDLVIIDVVMPVMNGPHAVEEMRHLENQIKVIYLTGYDSKEALASQLKRGTELVLNKPCPISRLSRMIREKLSQ